VFRGATRLTLDAKNRIAVPARYRDRLHEQCQGQLILTVDPIERDPCLLLYPLPTWEVIEQKLSSLPTLERQSRKLQRLMIGHATELEVDGHGRVRLPAELREFAGLDRAVMLIGQGNKFEVWDADRWIERRNGWLEEETEQAAMPAELSTLSL
jgi:MraZ protein